MMFASLILLAILVNRDAWKCIALTILIGTIHFLPYYMITDINLWYLTCIILDSIIVIAACNSRMTAVGFIGVLLVASHSIAWIFNTHEILHKPYHIIAPLLEYIQGVCLTLFSQPVLKFIKERVRQYATN
jgi:hypothetical protein